MIRRLSPIVAAVSLVLAGSAAMASTAAAACDVRYRPEVAIKVGSQTITAENAKTGAEKERGLAGRRCIGKNQAMLFAFALPVHISIWMKGMEFPIDVVWIGADHRVVWVERQLDPSTYPRHFKNKGTGALYILELAIGTRLSFKLPAARR
jgi:uncharacterized membrane protein (UPF0127 family)